MSSAAALSCSAATARMCIARAGATNRLSRLSNVKAGASAQLDSPHWSATGRCCATDDGVIDE